LAQRETLLHQDFFKNPFIRSWLLTGIKSESIMPQMNFSYFNENTPT